MRTHVHDFKPGDSVKVFNGGKLEGEGVIQKRLDDDNYYAVHFHGDDPRDSYKRWVFPHWQAPGFDPSSPDADALATLHYGTERSPR